MGITCNAVAPGIIDTGGNMEKEMTENKVLDLIPVNRFGTPEDVAEIVAFLSSKEAGYINGQVIKVDGGLYI
jgi:3-oxoacyl-[acyl-carrier protein] reductase